MAKTTVKTTKVTTTKVTTVRTVKPVKASVVKRVAVPKASKEDELFGLLCKAKGYKVVTFIAKK